MATEISSLISRGPQILLCGAGSFATSITEVLRAHGYEVVLNTTTWPMLHNVPVLLPGSDVVLIDVTAASSGFLNTLEELHTLIGISELRPRILCFSTILRNLQFVLGITNRGARYVRVDGPQMLLEAVELVFGEIRQLERSGPCFHIVHRFSQGRCGPGEEISAVLWAHNGEFVQLPLALSARFVFDFLAQHRRIRLDTLQIVSGLSCDWFYRDHAANSGHRQPKKIRRPTVKVLVKRIREAMAAVFDKAHLHLDPAEVLRSCPAHGSKRVLYQLHADIRWHHPSQVMPWER